MNDRTGADGHSPAGLSRGIGRLTRPLREFVYGMSGYEFARHAVEQRAAVENVFLLTLVGDMIGVPVIPPYYALRLLPHVVPEIATWKRRVLREREYSDLEEYHLHGV